MIRKILLSAAAGVALGISGLVVTGQALEVEPPSHAFETAEAFPNVELWTHDGRKVRFYDDLLAGKIVAINFFYISCTDF